MNTYIYNNIEFVVLEDYQNGKLCITKTPLHQAFCFDPKNKNDWEHSELRQYLNGVFFKTYFKESDLLKIKINLIADDGTYHGTGTSEEYISLLSDDLYRKYRQKMPTYNKSLWSVTPYSCNKELVSAERIIRPNGTLSVDMPLSFNAITPIVIFKKEVLGK